MEGANLPDPHGVGYLLTHAGEIHLQHLSYVNVNRSYDTIKYIRHPMKCTTTKIKPINLFSFLSSSKYRESSNTSKESSLEPKNNP